MDDIDYGIINHLWDGSPNIKGGCHDCAAKHGIHTLGVKECCGFREQTMTRNDLYLIKAHRLASELTTVKWLTEDKLNYL